jgi:hypothetical protein
MRWSGPGDIVNRVWPRHDHCGRPLNSVVAPFGERDMLPMSNNHKHKLGFVLAREWLWSNYFFWVGTLANAITSFFIVNERWRFVWLDFFQWAAILEPIFAIVPYVLFIYVRSLIAARRIVIGKDPAPDISQVQLNEMLSSADASEGQLHKTNEV